MGWINGVFYDLTSQANWSVKWQVLIEGKDLSSKMQPYLISISVTDKAGTASDSCQLTFDDTDDVINLDMEGKAIAVSLNGYPAFNGTVETARSQGSCGGGRIVLVTAKGFDTRGKAKQAQAFHMDDANLGKFLGAVAKDAGFDLVMDADLAGITRDYWSADYESFLDLGEKLAREVGGTFKIRGKQAVLVKRGENDLPTVNGVVGQGGNVISWDMAPFTGRSSYTKAEARWFDRKDAKFKTETIDIDLGKDAPDASNIVRMPMGDETQAKHRAGGRKSEAKRDAGVGTVTLDLAPDAQAEALFVLSGAKRDVDGNWRIDGVTHRADRAGGSITMLELKEPGAKKAEAKSASSKKSKVNVTKPAVETETWPTLPE
jgi:uncharacterized protein